MQYSTMRGNLPPKTPKTKTPASGVPSKRRGRPPKQPSPPPVDLYHRTDNPFVAFLCEWAGCRAELHNLETLRRHVYVVHAESGWRRCFWGMCKDKEPPLALIDREAFDRHAEEAHFVPFSWHVGDGPRNSDRSTGSGGDHDEGAVPEYLKDADGKQVTPSIRGQEIEDLITWRNNRRKLKELLVRRNENLPSEDEDEDEDDDLGEEEEDELL
jgi:hypothetical protein